MATFWFGILGTNLTHILSVNTLSDSDSAFLVPQMIHLLDRNQIVSHLVNKSEIHSTLSEIAKFISLSIVTSSSTLQRDKSVWLQHAQQDEEIRNQSYKP